MNTVVRKIYILSLKVGLPIYAYSAPKNMYLFYYQKYRGEVPATDYDCLCPKRGVT